MLNVSNDGKVESMPRRVKQRFIAIGILFIAIYFICSDLTEGRGQALTNAAGCVLLVIYVLGLVFWRRFPANHVALVVEEEDGMGNGPESSR